MTGWFHIALALQALSLSLEFVSRIHCFWIGTTGEFSEPIELREEWIVAAERHGCIGMADDRGHGGQRCLRHRSASQLVLEHPHGAIQPVEGGDVLRSCGWR